MDSGMDPRLQIPAELLQSLMHRVDEYQMQRFSQLLEDKLEYKLNQKLKDSMKAIADQQYEERLRLDREEATRTAELAAEERWMQAFEEELRKTARQTARDPTLAEQKAEQKDLKPTVPKTMTEEEVTARLEVAVRSRASFLDFRQQQINKEEEELLAKLEEHAVRMQFEREEAERIRRDIDIERKATSELQREIEGIREQLLAQKRVVQDKEAALDRDTTSVLREKRLLKSIREELDVEKSQLEAERKELEASGEAIAAERARLHQEEKALELKRVVFVAQLRDQQEELLRQFHEVSDLGAGIPDLSSMPTPIPSRSGRSTAASDRRAVQVMESPSQQKALDVRPSERDIVVFQRRPTTTTSQVAANASRVFEDRSRPLSIPVEYDLDPMDPDEDSEGDSPTAVPDLGSTGRPPAPPLRLHVSEVSSSHVTVRWKPAPALEEQKPTEAERQSLCYSVTVFDPRNRNCPITPRHTTANEIKFVGIDQDTHYEIHVQTVSRFGRSDRKVARFRTLVAGVRPDGNVNFVHNQGTQTPLSLVPQFLRENQKYFAPQLQTVLSSPALLASRTTPLFPLLQSPPATPNSSKRKLAPLPQAGSKPSS
eukprot:TRINITY_DN9544_c0_g1_i1.p1 TRINITY_DN9544_c0_g1~~TRINITY_DN9544_c0_g1_i1.p1  ORF type:complete len:601 (-),score=140.38 TRINITY_DN9544_c0_g1_i1:86-1888(-)